MIVHVIHAQIQSLPQHRTLYDCIMVALLCKCCSICVETTRHAAHEEGAEEKDQNCFQVQNNMASETTIEARQRREVAPRLCPLAKLLYYSPAWHQPVVK